jgi:hypothetical protein
MTIVQTLDFFSGILLYLWWISQISFEKSWKHDLSNNISSCLFHWWVGHSGKGGAHCLGPKPRTTCHLGTAHSLNFTVYKAQPSDWALLTVMMCCPCTTGSYSITNILIFLYKQNAHVRPSIQVKEPTRPRVTNTCILLHDNPHSIVKS